MSPFSAVSTLLSLVSTVGKAISSDTSASSSSNTSNSSEQTDFKSSLALRLAAQRGSALDSLLGSLSPTSAGKSDASSLASYFADAVRRYDGAAIKLPKNLSGDGRNLSLFDPESAYAMMSNINQREALYKSQFAELSEMRTALSGMRQAGERLGSGLDSLDDKALQTHVQTFVDQYNEWVSRFAGTVTPNGLLAGTQAAEISLAELRYSVESPFNGAMQGVRGLEELGITIDPVSLKANFDAKRFGAVLANQRTGALSALSDFSANFAKSADLLISKQNFVPNRLDNLDRAIHYISDHRSALQSEFGSGNAPRLSEEVSRALAAYEKMARA